jgi:hypothetical protein
MKTRYLICMLCATMLFAGKTVAQDPKWVKDNTWFFDNFTKDTLSWNLFRETFIGVAPAPSADFDWFFYDGLYRTKLAGPGLCYGMDVMALLMMKNGGHLGFCHPPYIYTGTDRPDDPILETAIEITHGNQINHGFLSFMLDVVAAKKLRDGDYAYAKVQEYLAKNDPPIICISGSTGGVTGDSGHVIVPYAVEQIGLVKKIWVYDPNRSYYVNAPDGKPFYDTHSNFIQIDPGGKWSFKMAGTMGTWFGDPGSGGRIVAAPLSVVGKKDRLPQSLFAEGAVAINTILIYGDVKIKQVSDMNGTKQLMNEAGNEQELCEEKRLMNILPFIPLNGGYPSKGSGRQKAFFFSGTDPLQFRFRAIGEYTIKLMFGGKLYERKGKGNGDVQYFKAGE